MEWARNACRWESSAKSTPALLYNVSPVLWEEEVVWEVDEGKSSKVEAQGSCSLVAPRSLDGARAQTGYKSRKLRLRLWHARSAYRGREGGGWVGVNPVSCS